MLSLLNDSDARSKLLLSRLADQPKSPALIGIAEVFCKQGRYSEAIARLRSVAEIYGDVYRFNLVFARACRDAGNMELAKQHYEKACQIAPQNEVAIKELITLTAFPHAVPKLSKPERAMKSESTSPFVASEPKKPDLSTSEPETPTVFKLDRDKLSKVLGGVVGSVEKNHEPSIEPQTPPASKPEATPSVMEAFRQADSLLEQKPDIDALAREMMGNAFLPQEPINAVQSAPQSDSPQQSFDSDTNATAQQISSISVADEPTESAPTDATSESTSSMTTPTHSSTTSAPTSIPLDENGNPIIKVDHNKLKQALSGIYKAKGLVSSETEDYPNDDNDTPFPMPTEANAGGTPEPPPFVPPIESPASGATSQGGGTLSFEEEIMAMQMQGGDVNAFIANKDTAHRDHADHATSAPSSSLNDKYDDIDALAREVMNAQIPRITETNDPTPLAEQRQPFPDDEEIKTPTRQLAKIFQSQGAYAKAIKVYEMLAEREPENASLYDILINELREKIKAQK